jgi:hypothetical protein
MLRLPGKSLQLALTAAVFWRLLLLAAMAAAPRTAAPETVFAVFTVNLTRFISWPEGSLGPPGAPLLIGTFPRDPINAQLDAAVRGEMVGDHPLQTVRLHSLDEVDKCRVVFISRGVMNPAAVLARAAHHPILTISDTDAFLTLGGHVRFMIEPPHTRLKVSADNLRASGLEARAQLLRVAAEP